MTIVGGGIGGLTLALFLHQNNISCRGLRGGFPSQGDRRGINLLPHAVKELDSLGLLEGLDRVGIRTKDASYFNQYGQHIYTEAAGIDAGYHWPQFSIPPG